MNPFTIGQTVTRKGTDIHSLVVATYRFQGRDYVKVRTSMKTPPISELASAFVPYVMSSPDWVMVKDDDGILWAFEILDMTADGSGVIFKRGEDYLDV